MRSARQIERRLRANESIVRGCKQYLHQLPSGARLRVVESEGGDLQHHPRADQRGEGRKSALVQRTAVLSDGLGAKIAATHVAALGMKGATADFTAPAMVRRCACCIRCTIMLYRDHPVGLRRRTMATRRRWPRTSKPNGGRASFADRGRCRPSRRASATSVCMCCWSEASSRFAIPRRPLFDHRRRFRRGAIRIGTALGCVARSSVEHPSLEAAA